MRLRNSERNRGRSHLGLQALQSSQDSITSHGVKVLLAFILRTLYLGTEVVAVAPGGDLKLIFWNAQKPDRVGSP